jgi:diaminohydroxyphosphoribosylaminopyrimidine deaminase/5-amino-6-(5-phosphoribosylamino)uracil reductase
MKDTLWSMLLHLQQSVCNALPDVRYCHLSATPAIAFDAALSIDQAKGPTCLIVLEPAAIPAIAADLVLVRTSTFHFRVHQQSPTIHSADLQFFQQYLPYAVLSLVAKKAQRAVTVAHFAQSLDGKIATASGHSKWIGNTENLIHAHRMRALCDAILVGSGTLQADKPKLTVRHVTGDNPIRIILGTSATDYSCLEESCSKEIIVIGSKPPKAKGQLRYIHLPRTDKHIDSHDILKHLYKEGISSVYIEGGPTTTSSFLMDQAIDILQLHLAPMILGGGIPCIQLPEIGEVGDACQFKHFWFHPVGDAMMFTGVL